MTPGGRPLLTHTSTFTTLFGKDQVDELVGGAYKKLEEDFEGRREYMDEAAVQACEARLGLLRHTWTLLKDRAD